MNLPLRIYKTIQTIELKFSWSENGILVIHSGSNQLFNVIYAWNAPSTRIVSFVEISNNLEVDHSWKLS